MIKRNSYEYCLWNAIWDLDTCRWWICNCWNRRPESVCYYLAWSQFSFKEVYKGDKTNYSKFTTNQSRCFKVRWSENWWEGLMNSWWRHVVQIIIQINDSHCLSSSLRAYCILQYYEYRNASRYWECGHDEWGLSASHFLKHDIKTWRTTYKCTKTSISCPAAR